MPNESSPLEPSNVTSESRNLGRRVSKLEESLKKKHWWEIVQALAMPIVIAGIGAWFAWIQHHQSEQNRIAQLAAEIESSRERADTEIRATMFEALIGRFFGTSLDEDQRIILLSLFQRNFQEFFNAGPLFELVDAGLTNRNLKTELVKVARAAAERQELILGAGLTENRALYKNQATSVPVGQHLIEIELTDIQEDRARVRVAALNPEDLRFRETEFTVSYFDMPLVDNTKLPDGHRLAFTLKRIDMTNGIAEMKVFEFPAGYLSSRDRPAFGELMQHLAVEDKKSRTREKRLPDHEHSHSQ